MQTADRLAPLLRPWRQMLAQVGAVSSMNWKSNCYDNAMLESFWSTPKSDLIRRTHFATRAAILNGSKSFTTARGSVARSVINPLWTLKRISTKIMSRVLPPVAHNTTISGQGQRESK